MLTLQYFDSEGEAAFHPLDREDATVTIGSAEHAEIRLHGAGVAAEHARIEPIRGRNPGFKLVDLGADGGETLLNGERVMQGRLGVGDRIEIGRAVLVVGTRVQRKVTAREVLATPTATTRRARTARSSSGSSSVWIVGAVVVGLAICVALFMRGGDAEPRYASEITRQAELGEFEAAHKLVARLRVEWAGTDAERVARVESLEASVAELERAVTDGRARIRAEAATKNRAQQFRALRASMKEHPGSLEGRASRILLTELDGLRDGVEFVPQPVAGALADGGAESQGDVDDQDAETPDVEVDRSAVPAAGSDEAVAVDAVAEARTRRESGDFTGALEVLAAGLAAEPSAEQRSDLETMRRLVADAVQAEVEQRLSRARHAAQDATVDGIDRGIAILERDPERVPSSLAGDVLQREVERLRSERAAAMRVESAREAAASVADRLEVALEAERAGRFGDALSALESVDPTASAAPADLADRRIELEALSGIQSWLIERAGASGGRIELVAKDGTPLDAHSLDGRRLVLVDGGQAVPWDRLLPARILGHVRDPRAPVQAVLGAAVLAYRAGQRGLADGLLAAHFERDDFDRGSASRIIARERDDEFVDERGYRLDDGALVSVRELESRAAAARVAKDLDAALKRPARERDAAFERILAEGAQVTDAVVLELRRQLDAYAERVANHRFKKVWDDLLEERDELDQLRAHALELVFDTERYFYPYKPPAVSSERAAEYRRVQLEIDDRIRAVREIWSKRRSAKRLPGALAKDVERLRWIEGTLNDFGESVGDRLDSIAWVTTLPTDGEGLTLTNFCRDAAERAALDEAARIHAYNRGLDALSKAEAEQVEITNAYRELLGRKPLAVSLELLESARGHAEEMSKLGYFSHYSPTPGRESPFDRMRLVGYERGNSENIALHPSAKSAHGGWTHSSGHHRNLLGPDHTEFGVGQDGKNWVQNFGSGRTYRGRY